MPNDEYLAAVERELGRVTAPDNPRYTDFYNIFHYHLGWTNPQGGPARADTGKRLRPLLCLWACEAVGGDWHTALPAAAAIELVHNFSLIHDDIEDNSPTRRGRTTVWHVWGMPQGVNAGDAMFALAHRALDGLSASVPPGTQVELRRVFDTAALKLTQGQYFDLAYEHAEQVTLEQYIEMVRGKTAALISAAAEIGARLGTSDTHIIERFAAYGEHLGIAFQISDDILGLWGDPAVTGKSARTDLASRKKSYPVLAAMTCEGGDELAALYARTEWTEAELARVERILEETAARGLAEQAANSFAQQALANLHATQLRNPAVTRLERVVRDAVQRDK